MLICERRETSTVDFHRNFNFHCEADEASKVYRWTLPHPLSFILSSWKCSRGTQPNYKVKQRRTAGGDRRPRKKWIDTLQKDNFLSQQIITQSVRFSARTEGGGVGTGDGGGLDGCLTPPSLSLLEGKRKARKWRSTGHEEKMNCHLEGQINLSIKVIFIIIRAGGHRQRERESLTLVVNHPSLPQVDKSFLRDIFTVHPEFPSILLLMKWKERKEGQLGNDDFFTFISGLKINFSTTGIQTPEGGWREEPREAPLPLLVYKVKRSIMVIDTPFTTVAAISVVLLLLFW